MGRIPSPSSRFSPHTLLIVLHQTEAIMTDVRIECPHCHKSFKLTETLAAPLVEETRRKLQREFEEKEEDFETRRNAFNDELKAADKARKELEKERAALAKQKEQVREHVTEQVEEQKAAIAREEARKAKQKYDLKLTERDQEKAALEAIIKERDEKLAESRKAELDFRRKQRELDDKIQAADVEVEKRVTQALGPAREKAKKEADEEYRLRLLHAQKKNEDLLNQLEEAKRRAEQGSQQSQGEIQELDLEARLRDAFPRDTIEPVPKGKHGGDAVHRIVGVQGQTCGTILWEFKRTKNWVSTWPDKLKQDQRTAKAELAVIVTQAMPPGVDSLGEIDGVWVTTPELAIQFAGILRHGLLEAFLARRASEGRHDKMAVLYQYLTGPEFRQRIEALKDAFTTMQADLITERAVFERQWAKRQKQIDRVMLSTVGLYGDLQGIAGATLPSIDGLELKALESGDHKETQSG